MVKRYRHMVISAFVVLMMGVVSFGDDSGYAQSDQSGVIVGDTGSSLQLVKCAVPSDNSADVMCLSDSTEEASYTFVLCEQNKACVPVFWSADDEPLLVQLSSESVGDRSQLVLDFAEMNRRFNRRSQQNKWVAGSLLGIAGVLEALYLARFKLGHIGHLIANNRWAYQVVALVLGVVGGSSYIASLLTPDVVPSYLGKTDGLIPDPKGFDQSYYTSLPEEKELIRALPHLMDTESGPYLIQDVPVDTLINLVAEALQFGEVSSQPLAKVCLPDQQLQSAPLNCSTPQGENTTGIDLNSYQSALADRMTQDTTTLTAEDVGHVESPDLADQSHSSQDLQNQVAYSQIQQFENQEGVFVNQVFAGLDYKPLLQNATESLCERPENLSVYADDRELFKVEGYFNCRLHLGGQACEIKYDCVYKPKDVSSCVQIAQWLNYVKIGGGYQLPLQTPLDMCESWFNQTSSY